MQSLLFITFVVTLSYGSHCPINQILEKCIMQPGGARFILSEFCDPFNPADPACFMRVEDHPRRTCCFCCNLDDERSLQRCKDRDEGVECRLPHGWLDRTIETGPCYERDFHYIGSPLKVYGTGSNQKSNVMTLQECFDECKRFPLCKWVNWDDSTGRQPNTCWLKKNRGNNYLKKTRQGGFTGHPDSVVECQDQSMFIIPEQMPTNNPCPNGILTENCYGLDICMTCCTGEMPGTDDTPACTH